jgi:hypothetical protein
MRARVLLFILSLTFAGVLAAVVGWRLTSEAMAVLVGVAAGVFASIPTSLLVVWVTTRQLRAERETWRDGVQRAAPPAPVERAGPPVIVLAPPGASGAQPAPGWPGSYLPPAAHPVRREFSVIGGDSGWDDS